MTEREPGADPISSLLGFLQDDTAHERANNTDPSLSCCCGNPACAHLQHNHSICNGLERDVAVAGKLGQVCGLVCATVSSQRPENFLLRKEFSA